MIALKMFLVLILSFWGVMASMGAGIRYLKDEAEGEED